MTRRRDNPFSHKNSAYEHPLRAPLRRVRGRFSLFALALLVLVLGVAYRQGTTLVTEGQLHSKHAFLAQDCAACHVQPLGSGAMAGTPGAHGAHGAEGMSANCMRCHLEMNLQPHGNLAAVTALRQRKEASGQAAQRSGFIAWANALPGGRMHSEAHATIACAVCHQEHRGQDAQQISLTEASCQACHRSTFPSFSNGHPEFTDLTTRPTLQVKFDHARHYGGAFAKMVKTDVQCSACHEQPTSAAMPIPRLKSAEIMCLPCHQNDVSPVDAVLLTSSAEEPSGFARIAALLAKDAAGKAPATLTTFATVAELAAVVGPAGKGLISGIDEKMLQAVAAEGDLKIDVATLPQGAWAVSNPEGEEQVQLAYRTIGHRDPHVVGWLQWLQAQDQAARKSLTGAALTEWSTAANDMVLDLGAATASSAKPSRCALCHFVGADERTGVSADFRKPAREGHFTRAYSHFVHAGQAEQHGASIDCRTCHVALVTDPGKPHDARWTAIHVERRPQDWRTIAISDCRSCHNDTTVRQDCATCHQYHQAETR